MNTIAGYTYKGKAYHPECISGALDTGKRGDFAGFGLAMGEDMLAEEHLNEIALHFDINRDDERTYSDEYFPKVITNEQAIGQTCDGCSDHIEPRHPNLNDHDESE